MEDAVLQALERDEAYRLVRVLASNPSGTTELVQAQGREGLLVRKRIPLELANRDAWGALAGVRCSRLPQVVEMYELPDVFVVVCDYVEGTTLKALVSSVGKLGAEQCLGILEDLCEAADALHARGVIHRDISPTNVIVAADGAHLIDLGIARVGGAAASHDTTRLGTFGFASPEQFGFAQTTARSDVYSLGCLAAYMLSGKAPDEEGFDQAIAQLDDPVRKVVTQARSFEPSKRYGSAPAFLAAFSQALGKAPRVEKPAPLPADAFVPAPVVPAAAPAAAPAREGFFIKLSEWKEAFNLAPQSKIVGALIITLVLSPAFVGFLSAAPKYFASEDPSGKKLLNALAALSLALMFIMTYIELCAAAFAAGPYKDPRKVVVLIKRVGIVVAVCLALAFLFILISMVVFGRTT